MSKIISVSSSVTGKTYEYVDTGEPMRGGMKDVYFSPDKSYVVALYRDRQDANSKERLKLIVTGYRDSLLNREGGEYWKNIFCWPIDVIEKDGLTGVIVPAYDKRFFFKKGYSGSDLIKGKEKEGKWFASSKFRSPQFPLRLDASELGSWLDYFQICLNIARGAKRLHAAGLAHSDLSYKNVLVDPTNGAAANIIDVDGLVVPGKFPPDVIGTPDFIAPEVLATKHLDRLDKNRCLPNRLTDLHALPVLIYMYLLHRHPLKGSKIHDLDTEKDDLLSMGEKALFIEHPQDPSNRPDPRQINAKELPWADIVRLPYTITGPYLKALFDQAFIDGLHHPAQRPPAAMWEQALLKTTDLMQPCANSACDQKWYVFDNTTRPRCPFCGTPHQGTLPVFDFYVQSKVQKGSWKPENHRLMIYHNQYLFQWHIDTSVVRNEKLTEAQKKPVGYFKLHHHKWVLVNQSMTGLRDLTTGTDIPVNAMVELENGKQLLLSREEHGKVAFITIANA